MFPRNLRSVWAGKAQGSTKRSQSRHSLIHQLRRLWATLTLLLLGMSCLRMLVKGTRCTSPCPCLACSHSATAACPETATNQRNVSCKFYILQQANEGGNALVPNTLNMYDESSFTLQGKAEHKRNCSVNERPSPELRVSGPAGQRGRFTTSLTTSFKRTGKVLNQGGQQILMKMGITCCETGEQIIRVRTSQCILVRLSSQLVTPNCCIARHESISTGCGSTNSRVLCLLETSSFVRMSLVAVSHPAEVIRTHSTHAKRQARCTRSQQQRSLRIWCFENEFFEGQRRHFEHS